MSALRVRPNDRVWLRSEKVHGIVYRNNKKDFDLMRKLYADSERDLPGYPVSLNWLSRKTGYFLIEAHGKRLWVHNNEVIRV